MADTLISLSYWRYRASARIRPQASGNAQLNARLGPKLNSSGPKDPRIGKSATQIQSKKIASQLSTYFAFSLSILFWGCIVAPYP